MSKRTIIIISGVLILIAVGAVIFASRQRKMGFVSPILEVGKPKESSGQILTYEDESGFSFQYPSTLGVVEKDVNDPVIYSSLELSSKAYPGEKLILKVTDTSLRTIDDWLGKNPQSGSLMSTTEVVISKMKGKNFKFNDPARNLILVLDNGILYYFESPADNGFWDQTLKTLSSSFKLTDTDASGTSAAGSVLDEGEEIIE